MKRRIAIAMSGGVDSSATALLLQREGHDVFGITALMSGQESRCCSSEDVCRAQSICEQLGIQHHVIDLGDIFETAIIDYFVGEYTTGRTPSPCVVCNRKIKFGFLYDEARTRGAECLATGHYARITEKEDGAWGLRRGVDASKDQSYFLSRLTQEQLGRSLLPLGGLTKKDVSTFAVEAGLASRSSRESQELCFITEGTHGSWIDVRVLETPGAGRVVDTGGRELGRHAGIHHYTVGQRRGLGIATGQPMYVVAIDRRRNEVVVGPRHETLRSSMTVRSMNWLAGKAPATEFAAQVQIRYNHKAAGAYVSVQDASSLGVIFEEPQFAIAPGQAAVLYDGDEVIGGGWIE